MFLQIHLFGLGGGYRGATGPQLYFNNNRQTQGPPRQALNHMAASWSADKQQMLVRSQRHRRPVLFILFAFVLERRHLRLYKPHYRLTTLLLTKACIYRGRENERKKKALVMKSVCKLNISAVSWINEIHFLSSLLNNTIKMQFYRFNHLSTMSMPKMFWRAKH